ncbi:hypothetical protein [Streptomyces sp. NBC_01506]|uniref:hypothetical protein n=1 Tax=Streptomyces sp. NBC_01506 TaxID=2903887 RepID=UPI00386CE5A8
MFKVAKRPDGLMRDVAGGAFTPRPGVMSAGVVLLLVAAMLWLSVAGNDPQLARATSLMLFLLILFAVRTGLGRRKARITVAVLTPLLMFVMLSHTWWEIVHPKGDQGTAYSVLAIVAAGCAGAGLALVFARRSSAYVRARTGVLAAR